MSTGHLSSLRRATVRAVGAVVLTAGVMTVTMVAATTPAQAAVCSMAGTTGLTAAMVATNSATISGTVNATGCDLGIYVPPGTTSVTINGATVTGANDEGILAEGPGTTNLLIENNTVEDNGATVNSNSPDPHALMLDGVSGAMVTNNTVKDNDIGGIGLADIGPTDPGIPNAGPNTAAAAANNTISGNTLSGNPGGCGIIIEAWDADGISGTVVTNNTVTGTAGKFGPAGPDVGQIVVADDAVGTSVTNTTIEGNTVSQSIASGITLHANAPNDLISNTTIQNNTLNDNNWGDSNGAPSTDAIALIVESFPASLAASITGTTITGNTMTDQVVGVWIRGATSTTIGTNAITLLAGGTAVFTVPTPNKGYWLAGSDGGAFAFGDATFYGSTQSLGLHLQKPVVAIAPEPRPRRVLGGGVGRRRVRLR